MSAWLIICLCCGFFSRFHYVVGNTRRVDREPTAWIAGAIALLFAASLAISLNPLVAQERSSIPASVVADDAPSRATSEDEQPTPPLTHYRGREIAATMHYLGASWLTREEREREEDCTTLLKALRVSPGQAICDLGCGNGFYTLRLAELTGEQGIVYGVDIQREMLEMLAERAKDRRIANIRPILSTTVDPKLPAESIDLMLLVDVYHELSNPEEMLKAIRASLRPTGRLVLVEFRLEDPNVPIKLLHKMSKEQVLAELSPNGFRLVEQFDKLPWQHVLFFQRDDAPPPAADGERIDQ